MGNKNSHSKQEQLVIKNIQEFNQIESEKERHEKLLEYYFSNDTDSIDRFHIKPNNVEFIKASISNGLSFGDNEFDFTHIELLRLFYTVDQWDFILTELIRVTKPGGYIEVSGRRRENVVRAPIFFYASGSRRNLDTNLIYNLKSKFELQSNLGNVHRTEENFVIGPNGGKIGMIAQDLALGYFKAEPLVKTLSEEMGVSKEEYKNMIEKDLLEEFKQSCSESIYVRIWTQKLS
ncbi:6727_t:CDS:2 [Rhizophagus irregularis]|nr:6727_t:CDS:2 [Rhizophagus irregularis]